MINIILHTALKKLRCSNETLYHLLYFFPLTLVSCLCVLEDNVSAVRNETLAVNYIKVELFYRVCIKNRLLVLQLP